MRRINYRFLQSIFYIPKNKYLPTTLTKGGRGKRKKKTDTTNTFSSLITKTQNVFTLSYGEGNAPVPPCWRGNVPLLGNPGCLHQLPLTRRMKRDWPRGIIIPFGNVDKDGWVPFFWWDVGGPPFLVGSYCVRTDCTAWILMYFLKLIF